MNDNVERSLEIGVGMLMCIIAIHLFFLFQKLIDTSYQYLFSKIGG